MVNKITSPITPLGEIDKINELVDGVNNAGTVKKVNNTSPDSNGNVSITIPTVNNATLTITQGGTTKGTFTANASSDVTIDLNAGGGGVSRNIGEIVSSTIPLTDAGLHLLDGALISGSGVYSAFVTYIAGLRTQYSNLFTTESAWQSTVTQYGVCGKFVYNSRNNTVRLPKYSNKIWSGEGTAPVVGNGIGIGITDGTNYGGLNWNDGGNNAVIKGPVQQLYGTTVGSTHSSTTYSLTKNVALGVTTDPTKSGLIADLSGITTSLDGYYYIVIATSTKTDIQVDIDNIATDLNGKADIDLTNVPSSKGILTKSYKNGSSWYRVYADGWCEQGGILTVSGTSQVINFLKPYINTNYIITYANGYNSVPSGTNLVCFGNKTTNSITRFGSASWTLTYWRTEGYIR